ncbi:MAG: hypothetical protein GEV12_23325, partial [Micromonosporaceae bacterium]|nr:hypothetical protein [Micromonosporaceae bacterium]
SEASDAVGGSGSERSSEASDAVGGSGSERSSEASDAVGGSGSERSSAEMSHRLASVAEGSDAVGGSGSERSSEASQAVGGPLDVFGGRWPARLVGSHLMVDEAVAFAIAQTDPGRRRTAYWLTGGALFLAWNVGTTAGVLVGGAVGDPEAFGLDAAFPAGLLALLWPSLRDPVARRVAVLGAAVALLTAPLLPAGAPVLLGLVGLAAAAPLPRRRRTPRRERLRA